MAYSTEDTLLYTFISDLHKKSWNKHRSPFTDKERKDTEKVSDLPDVGQKVGGRARIQPHPPSTTDVVKVAYQEARGSAMVSVGPVSMIWEVHGLITQKLVLNHISCN